LVFLVVLLIWRLVPLRSVHPEEVSSRMMLVRRLRGLVFDFLLVLDLATVAAVPLLQVPLLVEVVVVVDRFEGLVADSIYWTSGRRCFDFSSGLARVGFLVAVLAAAMVVVDSHCCWVLVLVLADRRCRYWVLHLAPVPAPVDYCHCRYRYWYH
jgi:hypothetical protein